MSAPIVRVCDKISELPRAEWDALVDDHATPFLRWEWLEALEHSGCASAARGWRPRHLSLWQDGRLCAAAPAYERDRSDGDFARDWGWAEAVQRAGFDYYPKLVLGVPFTPVTGRRILAAPDCDRRLAVEAIATGACALAEREGLSSVHVLFPTASEMAELEALGFARRMDFQFHWVNRSYSTPADWLAGLNAKRRHQARREKAAPKSQGISIRTVRGQEIHERGAAWAGEVHRLYRANAHKQFWGRAYLNASFFLRVFAAMPEHLEVVVAERAGQVVAGAFNVSSATHLYGRYWGCHEEHPFLHFNVCLYHSIDDCIVRGLRVFEGGAGGEHKATRGFEPTPVHSAHHFVEPRLDRSMRDYLSMETHARSQALERWRAGK